MTADLLAALLDYAAHLYLDRKNVGYEEALIPDDPPQGKGKPAWCPPGAPGRA
jgi:hypothetical protein